MKELVRGATRSLAKKDFEQLSEFRYQMRRFERFSEQARARRRHHAAAISAAAAHQGLSGPRLGDRRRTGRAASGAASRRGRAGVALRGAGSGQAAVSETDRRQVEVHLLNAGEQAACAGSPSCTAPN